MSPFETKRANALTRKALLALYWENYAPVLALAALCIFLFSAGAAFGLWQRIGDPWRAIALLATICGLVLSIRRTRQHIRPGLSAARRRAELDNGLSHRPLDTITDTQASPQTAAQESRANDRVWDLHKSGAQAALQSARAPKVRPALAPIDKYYLRFIVPALLLLGVMVGAGDNYERLRTALKPGWLHGISAKNASYEAWIDPPQYTGRPPTYFKTKTNISAPEGSEFVARISGVKTAPRLIIRDGRQTRRITPKRLGPKSFEARAVLKNTASASFRIGSTAKTWRVNIGEDAHPKVQFDDLPEAGKRDRLIFSYSLSDDFGVEQLSLVLALTGSTEKDEIPIELPGRIVKTTDKEPVSLDLTKHKWAGKKVSGHLVAADGRGQLGASKPADFIVPDKIFVEPLAKAIAEQRSFMIADTKPYAPLPKLPDVQIGDLDTRPLFSGTDTARTIERAPASVQRAALLIEAVTDKPAGVFDDPAVYMGLRNVYRRLQTAHNRDALGGTAEDLWDIALRAEFGRLGDALEDMRAAERALNNAMARRAPQREIDALFDRYNAAVDRYIEALTLEAIERAKQQAAQQDGGAGGGADMATDEIQDLLDAIEEANRIGDTAAARKALARLAQLLENMQIELAQGGGGGAGVADGMSEELEEALEELNDLLGDQRQLRDETQSAERESTEQRENGNQPGSQSSQGKTAEELARDQQALAELLDDLENGIGALEELGEGQAPGEESGEGNSAGGEDNESGEGSGGREDIKQALRDAKGAMRDSEDALNDGDYYGAGEAQTRAIEALRDAGGGLYAAEKRRLAEENQDGQRADGDGETDPFGRENNSSGVGDEVEVPEIDEQQRARDLLDELRKRSGDQDREKQEREYLERLLEQF